MAATETKIHEGAILGFHGSAESTANGFAPFKLLMKKDITAEQAFLAFIGKPNNLYLEFDAKRQSYVDKHEMEDVNFWMVGPSFFAEYKVNLGPDSYFPATQEELDVQVKHILEEKKQEGEDVTLAMTSDFLP